MNEVLEYFKSIIKKPFEKEIHVYGWQKEYDRLIISSVCNYLFESLDVIENIAPITNENREGIKKTKYYVTVHDTGDALKSHTAKFWSEAVYNEAWEGGTYACSYQYVVGNDGIYHNIPDDEIAWHAGDSTRFDYHLYETVVTGENKYPIITISEDGFYEIDGNKSILKAPRAIKTKDGNIIYDRICETKDINDEGVLCKLIDGRYYIGKTYYNAGFGKIANRGGNNNSIGIESCINEGSDIYLTWQRTAKLVAKILLNNNLTIDDVKQHHYFSGKNCPQTIRMNNMWTHFLDLVKCEFEVLKFINKGYEIKLKPLSDSVLENGRIKTNNNIKFSITVTFDGITETMDFSL